MVDGIDFAYVDGEFVPKQDARISIYDRGFLFADAVYEVTAVLGGKLVDNGAHLQRLFRSLHEIRIDPPYLESRITAIQLELIERNQLREGVVYLQVSRGVAPERDFPFPDATRPSFVAFTQEKTIIKHGNAERGIRVVSTPDLRWKRCDIKTVSLLASCLAKQHAIEQGAHDAWLVDENGFVTEGSSNNALIVDSAGTLITRGVGNETLPGITRRAILRIGQQSEACMVEERPFTLEEALRASEAMVTSASTLVWPVIAIDGTQIGAGVPGPVARMLRQAYLAEIDRL